MRWLAPFLLSLFLALPAAAQEAWPNEIARGCASKAGAVDPNETESTAIYLNLVTGAQGASDAAVDWFIQPISTVAHSLRVEVSAAPGGSEQWQIQLMNDGAGTAVLCEIIGAATTCDSAILSATLLAGTDATIKIIENGPGTPALASEMKISVCF